MKDLISYSTLHQKCKGSGKSWLEAEYCDTQHPECVFHPNGVQCPVCERVFPIECKKKPKIEPPKRSQNIQQKTAGKSPPFHPMKPYDEFCNHMTNFVIKRNMY
jgi:hypothetical protein